MKQCIVRHVFVCVPSWLIFIVDHLPSCAFRGEKALDAAAMSVDPMALGTATQENLKSMPPVVMDEDI